MKHPLKQECNTTFDVTITGPRFSSNRVHHLLILRINIAEIFFSERERERQRESERERVAKCIVLCLSNLLKYASNFFFK